MLKHRKLHQDEKKMTNIWQNQYNIVNLKNKIKLKKKKEEEDILPKMLIWLVWSFMFLIPWTYAYQSNVFYHGHESVLV